MTLWQNLVGTTSAFFRLGLTGVRLKDNSGNLSVRNTGDTADAEITASKVNVSGTQLLLNSGTNALTLERNSSQSAAMTVRFPATKGTAGMVMAVKSGTTSDILELEAVSAGSTASCEKDDVTSLAFGSTSPVAMYTLPAGDTYVRTKIIIDTPFNTAASMSVGISGTASKYVSSTQVDLTAAAGTMFIIEHSTASPGSDENIIITYSANGATAGAARVIAVRSTPS